MCFEAAPVAHHALEMFLKAALINEGYTIFNPNKLSQLDPSEKLDEAHCAWSLGTTPARQEFQFRARNPIQVPALGIATTTVPGRTRNLIKRTADTTPRGAITLADQVQCRS